MKQQAAITRALATNPEILLMDELFGAPEQRNRMFIGQELLCLWEETAKQSFLSHTISTW